MKKLFTLIAATMMAASTMFAGTTVGATDNSDGWWTAFSDYYTLVDGQTATITFTNYSDKALNWHNWLLVVTNNEERGGDDYAEYFVLRADNYGWGAQYENGTLTSNFNWDTFLDDMDGSKVAMTVTRDGNKITVHADMTTTTETTYFENYEVEIADLPEAIGFFLTVENAHLEDLTVAVANNINAVPVVAESNNAAVYNLAGQRVGDNYRGLIVKNGKKFINK